MSAALRSVATEFSAVQSILVDVADGRPVPVAEATTTIHLLHGILHSAGKLLLPFIRAKEPDRYAAARTFNVAVLAMGLARGLDHPPEVVRTIGLAALLRDVGKPRVPPEWFEGGKLSPEHAVELRRHPVVGARMLLGVDACLDLPAVVAYEHHLRPDGLGYPELRYPRTPHYASQLVQVCDVYDSLSTPRGTRRPWPYEKVLEYLKDRSGIEFDRRMAKALLDFMKDYDKRVLVIRDVESPLPLD